MDFDCFLDKFLGFIHFIELYSIYTKGEDQIWSIKIDFEGLVIVSVWAHTKNTF